MACSSEFKGGGSDLYPYFRLEKLWKITECLYRKSVTQLKFQSVPLQYKSRGLLLH